jgi:hypothetical protein
MTTSAPVPSDARAGHSPRITVKPLALIPPPADLPGLRAAFAGAQPIPLRQNFPGGDLSAPPTSTAWIGWNDSILHILAELSDDCIQTRATTFNQMLCQLGDCFEIFLKAPESPSYLEFHLAPNNVTLQLLYPSHAEFDRCRDWPEAEFLARFALPRPVFDPQVWLEARRWTVFASIDLRLLLPSLSTLANQELQFHFGRYDYPPDGTKPILSCSSVLSRLDFHAIPEWGRLVLKATE